MTLSLSPRNHTIFTALLPHLHLHAVQLVQSYATYVEGHPMGCIDIPIPLSCQVKTAASGHLMYTFHMMPNGSCRDSHSCLLVSTNIKNGMTFHSANLHFPNLKEEKTAAWWDATDDACTRFWRIEVNARYIVISCHSMTIHVWFTVIDRVKFDHKEESDDIFVTRWHRLTFGNVLRLFSLVDDSMLVVTGMMSEHLQYYCLHDALTSCSAAEVQLRKEMQEFTSRHASFALHGVCISQESEQCTLTMYDSDRIPTVVYDQSVDKMVCGVKTGHRAIGFGDQLFVSGAEDEPRSVTIACRNSNNSNRNQTVQGILPSQDDNEHHRFPQNIYCVQMDGVTVLLLIQWISNACRVFMWQ